MSTNRLGPPRVPVRPVSVQDVAYARLTLDWRRVSSGPSSNPRASSELMYGARLRRRRRLMSSNRSADGAETRSEASRAGEQPAQRPSEAAGQQGQVETPEELGDDGPDELLIDGQEEVFSRTEIESGRVEHHVGEERAAPVSSSRKAAPE